MKSRRFDQYVYVAAFFLMFLSTLLAQAQNPAIPTQTMKRPQISLLDVSSNDAADSSLVLPDAPTPEGAQTPTYVPTPKQDEHTHINPIALLSPRLINGQPMTAHDKFEIYIHKSYSPAAVIFPMFGAGIRMAKPKQDYPPEWKDGMGAFGRNYGDAIARRTAASTAEFTTQVLFHEDPRYARSTSSNTLVRIGHAFAWTFVDRSDSGHPMLAMSTFTGAAAGSFVGMAYLPDGFNDVSHADSSMFLSIGGKVFSNELIEFEPTWGPLARKLHIPRILPAWWTPQHK